MKRTLLTLGVLVGIGAGGGAWVSAQTAAAPKAHDHDHAAAAGVMGGGSMCGGMSMMGADAKVEVKNIDKGVTITITSTDPAKVKRLQKMAEAMRLMHEANMP